MRAALFCTWEHLILSTVFQFDNSELAPQASPPPLKKRSKATEWHRFLLYEKLRTCLPLRKRPWLHHRKLSPGLQHGIIATVTQVPFIECYVRNVAIFPKKIGVNSIKIVGLLSWGEKLHSRSLRCCVTLFTHITFPRYPRYFKRNIIAVAENVTIQLRMMSIINTWSTKMLKYTRALIYS